MFYGSIAWDPWLILAQIVCLQCFYYLILGLSLSLLVGTRVSRLSLVYFFDFVAVTPASVTGWCVISSFFISSLAGCLILHFGTSTCAFDFVSFRVLAVNQKICVYAVFD
ncbi:Protein SYS1 homolog [Linum perenne]